MNIENEKIPFGKFKGKRISILSYPENYFYAKWIMCGGGEKTRKAWECIQKKYPEIVEYVRENCVKPDDSGKYLIKCQGYFFTRPELKENKLGECPTRKRSDNYEEEFTCRNCRDRMKELRQIYNKRVKLGVYPLDEHHKDITEWLDEQGHEYVVLD
jgi:hypothetical protein